MKRNYPTFSLPVNNQHIRWNADLNEGGRR